MYKKIKIALLIAVIAVSAFATAACGSKDEPKESFECANGTERTLEYVKAVNAEDPNSVKEITSGIEAGKSGSFNLSEKDREGKYLLQIKFEDSDFVYTSKEVAFDSLTKIKLSEADGKVVLEVVYGDEVENIFLEQPAPKEEENGAADEAMPEEDVAAPAPQIEQSEPAPQPSAPAEPPVESKPQQDGCLNDALFN